MVSSAGGEAGGQAGDAPGRPLPPVTPMAAGSLALVVVGGIDLAAYLPHHPPLGPAVGLLAASTALLLVNLAVLSRVRDFAWHMFFLVGGWTLAAYVVVAGMLEYVFLLDGTRGGVLAVLTLMLVVFAVDIPLLLAFSVARHQPARGAGPG